MSKHNVVLKKERTKRNSFIEITPSQLSSPLSQKPLSPITRTSAFSGSFFEKPSVLNSPSSHSSPSNNSLVQQSPRFNPSSSFVKTSPPNNNHSPKTNSSSIKFPTQTLAAAKPSRQQQELLRRETLFNLTKPSSPLSASSSPDVQDGLINADGEVMKHLPVDRVVNKKQRKKIIKQIYLGYELPDKKPQLPRADSKIMKETVASSMKSLPKVVKESYYQRPPTDSHKQSAKDIFKRRYSTKLGIPPAPSTPGNPTKPQGRMRTFSLNTQATPLNTTAFKPLQREVKNETPPRRAFGSPVCSGTEEDSESDPDSDPDSDEDSEAELVENIADDDEVCGGQYVESVGSSEASSLRSSVVNTPNMELFQEYEPEVVKSTVFVKLEKESSTSSITNDMSLKDFGNFSLSDQAMAENLIRRPEEPLVELETPEKEQVIEEEPSLADFIDRAESRMEPETPVDESTMDFDIKEEHEIKPTEEQVEEEPLAIEKEEPPAEESSETSEEYAEDSLEVERIDTPVVEQQEVTIEEKPMPIEVEEPFIQQDEPVQEVEEKAIPVQDEEPPKQQEEPAEQVLTIEEEKVEIIEETKLPEYLPVEEEKISQHIEEPKPYIEEVVAEEPKPVLEEKPMPIEVEEPFKQEEEPKQEDAQSEILEKKENALVRLLKSGGKKLERTLSAKFRSKNLLLNERPSSSPSRARRDSVTSATSAPDVLDEKQPLPTDVTCPESKAVTDVEPATIIENELSLPSEPELEKAPPVEEEPKTQEEGTLEDLLSLYEESYVEEQSEFLQMVESPSFNGLDESPKKLFDNVSRFEAIPPNILSRPISAKQRTGSPNALFRAKSVTKIHSKDKKLQIEEFLKEEEETSPESPLSSSLEYEDEENRDNDSDEIEVSRREITFAENKLTRPTSATIKHSPTEKFTRPTTAHHLKSKDSPKAIQKEEEEEEVYIREVEESSEEEEPQPKRKITFSNVQRFNETQGEELERPLSARVKKDKSSPARPTTASRIKFKDNRCNVGPTAMEMFEYDPNAGADRFLELKNRMAKEEDRFTEEFEWTRPNTPKVEYYDDDDFISRPGSARTIAAEPPENDVSDTSSSHSSETNSVLFEKLHTTLSRPSSSPAFKKPRSASLTSKSSSSQHLIRKTYLPQQPETSEEELEDAEEEIEVGKLSRSSSISSSLSSSPPAIVNSPTNTSPTFISLMKKRADSSSSLGQKPSSPSSKNGSPRKNSKIIPFVNFVETESDATSEGSSTARNTVDLNGISTKFIDLNNGSFNVRRNSVSSSNRQMLDLTSVDGSRRLIDESPTYPGYIPKFLPRPYSLPLLSKVRHGVVRLSVFMEMHLANDFQILKNNANVRNVPYMEEGFDKSSLNTIINDENPYMFIRRTRYSTGFLICPLSTTPGKKNYLLTSARNVQSYLTTKLTPEKQSVFIERKVIKISANFLDNIEVGEKHRSNNTFASVAEVECQVEYCGSFYNTLNVNQDWAILSFTFSEDIKYIDREKYKFLKSGVIAIPSPSQLFLLIKHLVTKTAASKKANQESNLETVVGDYMMCVNGLYSDREELSNITKVTAVDDYSVRIVRDSMDPMACSLAFLVKGSSFSHFEYANYSTPSFTGAPITACAISMEGLDEVLKESDRRHNKNKKTLRGKSENQNIADFAKTNSCVFTRYVVGIHSTVSSNSKFHGVGCSVMNWFDTFYNLVYKPNRRRFAPGEKELIELEYESYISLSNGRVPSIPGAGACKVM